MPNTMALRSDLDVSGTGVGEVEAGSSSYDVPGRPAAGVRRPWTAALVLGLGLAGCFSEVTAQPGTDAGTGCEPDCPDATPAPPPPDAPAPPPPPPFTNGASTLAGTSEAGSNDGDRGIGRFDDPVNVVRGPDGRTYVADFNNGLIRVIDDSGAVTTLVSRTGFQHPFGLAFGPDGFLYVTTDDSDTGQHSTETGTIWRVDVTTGHVTVIARDLGRPRGLAVLPDGRFFLSDNEHHVVSVLEPRTGAVSIIAGQRDTPGYDDSSGIAARFNRPYGVAVLPSGKVAVADYGNNVVRLVELSGEVHTLVGSPEGGMIDGALEIARFANPQDVAADAAGNIYVADSHNFVVRRITDTAVVTVAGNQVSGYLDHDDPLQAQFYGLEGIDISADGKILYVADGDRGEGTPYHRVRHVRLATP